MTIGAMATVSTSDRTAHHPRRARRAVLHGGVRCPDPFVPDCHIGAPLRVEYFKGELRMYCAECGRHCGSYPVAA
jgi:hypothetical protein